MSQRLVAGTRGSRLAVAQCSWVCERLRMIGNGLVVEQKIVKTTGDFLQENPPPVWNSTLPKGLFTKELQEELLRGEIDFAVHSLKDLPTEHDPRFEIVAIPPRVDATDVLLKTRGYEIKAGAVVLTGSPRRQWQWMQRYPQTEVQPIRGNVDTRLKKIENGGAIIIAAAGLQRLGLSLEEEYDVEWLHWMLPAAGQGALGVEIRAGDEETTYKIRPIHCHKTELCVRAERTFLQAMGGGCMTPTAVLARVIDNGMMNIQAAVKDSSIHRAEITGEIARLDELVIELKQRFTA